ncbi:MAG: glycosyltransferase family 4 protein [Vicinamibacteria bacterium]|nr:glycosyltransferase family 4 protein [Vicinamibacteria bacterium]
MRILTVTSSYPKYPGDITAPFIESIARALSARGHEIDVVLPAHPELNRPASDPFRFHPYRYTTQDRWCRWGYAQSLEADVRIRRGSLLLAPLATLALRRMVSARLAARSYDIAHIHWIVPNAVPLVDLFRRRRLPFIVSLHGSDVFLAERSSILRLACRFTFVRAGAVSACSADLTRRAIRLGAAVDRTHTVPYGVDIDLFSPGKRSGRTRDRYRIPAGDTLVVAVGRLVKKKGFDCLIEAIAQCPGTRLLLVGSGDLRQSLEEQTRGLCASVVFAGALDRENTAEALADADISVIPSVIDSSGNVDGLPNALLEALSSGSAIVASRVAGIPDVIEDGVNGRLFQPADIRELALRINELRKDSVARERLGREARRLAVENLGWDATAKRLEDCFVQAKTLASH